MWAVDSDAGSPSSRDQRQRERGPLQGTAAPSNSSSLVEETPPQGATQTGVGATASGLEAGSPAVNSLKVCSGLDLAIGGTGGGHIDRTGTRETARSRNSSDNIAGGKVNTQRGWWWFSRGGKEKFTRSRKKEGNDKDYRLYKPTESRKRCTLILLPPSSDHLYVYPHPHVNPLYISHFDLYLTHVSQNPYVSRPRGVLTTKELHSENEIAPDVAPRAIPTGAGQNNCERKIPYHCHRFRC